jgi:hypothetical protein
LDEWSLRRRRLRVRRVGFGTKRIKAAADKDKARKQSDEQSSGYRRHLRHPHSSSKYRYSMDTIV